MSQDTLSDVLRAVRLRGAIFYYLEGASPWVAEAPPAPEIIPAIMPGVDHMIEFHGLVEGSCWAAITGEPPIRLSAGDLVLFPQGDAHVMSSAPGLRAPSVDTASSFRRGRHSCTLSMRGAEILTARSTEGARTARRSSAASWASTRGPSTRCSRRSRACCTFRRARSEATPGSRP
jgi:uncharacterized cupin superfamily protein